jgi:ATP-binding cassette subfamily B protein
MFKRFPHYTQLDMMDCGATCLRMIAKYYGRHYTLQFLRERSHIDREGASLRGLIEAAEAIGFNTLPVKLAFDGDDEEEAYLTEVPLPCIVHWKQNHFVVVYKISRQYIWIANPAGGKTKLTHAAFLKNWRSDGEMGVALLLEPTPVFYEEEGMKRTGVNIRFLANYLRPYRRYWIQLMLGLLLGSLFQLLFPFLTQAIVDIGIKNQDIGFIYLILVAQLALFVGQATVQVLQNFILMHISTRVNVSLISDFLAKLMKLPIGFFDAKMVGDLLQRIVDHRRIERFLVDSGLNFLFSAFTLFILGFVLLIYDWKVFLIFFIASVLYVGWLLLFLARRRNIDHLRFQESSNNQSMLIELIQGMQEIKLQNSGRKRRWLWSDIQARLFNANLKVLKLEQTQETGARFITQLKDILITFLTAKLVIEGELTLGMLLAVQFIIGQLNVPLQRLIVFIRSAQDARISMERLQEVQEMDQEEDPSASALDQLPQDKTIKIEGLTFRYNQLSDPVLQDINLEIPAGKMTAIVGTSGSGKTTLVKLLLGFYEPEAGSIKVGQIPLRQINKHLWRQSCGAVMQDGFIFSDTIANNIAESESRVDKNRLIKASKVANLTNFIEGLPLGYNTMIGPRGNGISQGQRQRILIARAIYKNPMFLFFDEATNALDAQNEKEIIEQLDQFFQGRTAVVVAHRLSTVRNADQIIVIEKGRIVEQGNHESLIEQKGTYFHLIKNQLELGG